MEFRNAMTVRSMLVGPRCPVVLALQIPLSRLAPPTATLVDTMRPHSWRPGEARCYPHSISNVFPPSRIFKKRGWQNEEVQNLTSFLNSQRKNYLIIVSQLAGITQPLTL